MSARRAPLALLGLLLWASPARAEVMLHAFGWRYRLVEQRAAAIAAAGSVAVEAIAALYGLGGRGFRLDAAKHMGVAELRAAVPEAIANSTHVFAEVISWGGAGEASYGRFLEPYLRQLPASFGAYDFPLFHTLRQALLPAGSLTALADPYGQGQALEARRAVTVAVTHDIPANAGFRFLILDPIDEQLAYAYLLGRDGGTPLVFDDGSAERFDGGRWVGAWQQGWLRQWIAFHNRMHGLPMTVLHADRCSLVWRRGPAAGGAVVGLAAINKCAEVQELSVPTPRGRWRWQPLERGPEAPVFRIGAGQLRLRLEPRRALVWIEEGRG